MKIGFIGLGIMGSRMAANLQKGGHDLVVHNRSRTKAALLVAGGAAWADSPAEVAANSEVVFTMLAHPAAVEEAATGPAGIFSGLAPGRLWVDCSTVNPSFSKRMAEQARAGGIRFLDAPVTGSKEPAASGKLAFWVGGPEYDLAACRPLLECMGSKVVHCGGPGAGTAVKMVNNQLLGTTLVAFAEGLALGESLGLSRETLLDALLSGTSAAPFLALKRARIEKGDYESADFPLRWLQKDLHLATMSAFETGVAMPLTNVAKEVYRLGIRHGLGDQDISAIFGYLDEQQDVPARPVQPSRPSSSARSEPPFSLSGLRVF